MARQLRVSRHDLVGGLTRLLHQGLVADHLKESQRGAPTRLSGAEDVPFAPCFQIHASERESIGRGGHRRESFPGRRARLGCGDQKAESVASPAGDATAQLVEL